MRLFRSPESKTDGSGVAPDAKHKMSEKEAAAFIFQLKTGAKMDFLQIFGIFFSKTVVICAYICYNTNILFTILPAGGVCRRLFLREENLP